MITLRCALPPDLAHRDAAHRRHPRGAGQAHRGRLRGGAAEKEESEAALAAYEKSLAEARNRAQAIGTEIRDKLHAEAEERRKALEAKLNAQLAEAEKQIAATKTAAMANVRGIAVDAASAIVERLIGTAPPAPAVAAAVDEALKR